MLEYGFYNSVNGDRRYDSVQMSEIFEGLITDGVYASVGEKFAVTPGEGMQILVGTGRAWFNGTWSKNRAKYPINIEASDPLLNRIDSVCLKVNKTDAVRGNSLIVIKGIPTGFPVPPAIPEEADVYYHILAYIHVNSSITSITASNIEITVGTVTCPFTTSILQQTDISMLFAQWTDQFMTWWDGIKAILDGDIVGNLLNAIDAKVDKSDKADMEDAIDGRDDSKWMTPKTVETAMYKPGTIFQSGERLSMMGKPYKVVQMNYKVIDERYLSDIDKNKFYRTPFTMKNSSYVYSYGRAQIPETENVLSNLFYGLCYNYPSDEYTPIMIANHFNNYSYYDNISMVLIGNECPYGPFSVLFEYDTVGVTGITSSSNLYTCSVYYKKHIYTIFSTVRTNMAWIYLYRDGEVIKIYSPESSGYFWGKIEFHVTSVGLALSTFVKATDRADVLYYSIPDSILDSDPVSNKNAPLKINTELPLISRIEVIPATDISAQTNKAIETITTLRGAKMRDNSREYRITSVNTYKSVITWISNDGVVGVLAESPVSSEGLVYKAVVSSPATYVCLTIGVLDNVTTPYDNSTTQYGLYKKINKNSKTSLGVTYGLYKPAYFGGSSTTTNNYPYALPSAHEASSNVFKIDGTWYAWMVPYYTSGFRYYVLANLSTSAVSGDVYYWGVGFGTSFLPDGKLPYSSAIPGYTSTAYNYKLSDNYQEGCMAGSVLGHINDPYNVVAGSIEAPINSIVRIAGMLYDNRSENFVIYINGTSLSEDALSSNSGTFANGSLLCVGLNKNGEYDRNWNGKGMSTAVYAVGTSTSVGYIYTLHGGQYLYLYFLGNLYTHQSYLCIGYDETMP